MGLQGPNTNTVVIFVRSCYLGPWTIRGWLWHPNLNRPETHKVPKVGRIWDPSWIFQKSPELQLAAQGSEVKAPPAVKTPAPGSLLGAMFLEVSCILRLMIKLK